MSAADTACGHTRKLQAALTRRNMKHSAEKARASFCNSGYAGANAAMGWGTAGLYAGHVRGLTLALDHTIYNPIYWKQ